ncbi:MAG: hypothetical protein ISS64_05020 [Desulfobacterales bacterium]|nr:hypothetical protein [Desulfobacterales bacterium]
MKKIFKKNPGVDWAVVGSIAFWVMMIAIITALLPFFQPKTPHIVLEITEAAASRGNLAIAPRNGDALWFANTKCIWTPDISAPDVTEDAGALVLAGEEAKEGIVSKLESGEVAKLEKDINMTEGNDGRLLIIDVKSGQQIFSQTVKITK